MTGQPASAAQERNLEQARRLVAFYEREGVWAQHEHFDEFHHPDYTWSAAISQLGDQLYRSRDGVREWLTDMEAVAADFSLREFEVRAVGDRHILMLSQMRLVGKESGVPVDGEYGGLFEMEDGRARSGRGFLSHAEAERAASEVEGADAEA